jgi:hypothetical protein
LDACSRCAGRSRLTYRRNDEGAKSAVFSKFQNMAIEMPWPFQICQVETTQVSSRKMKDKT